jgi:UDP-N-acetylglucosamine--N-acetylmuramyl-(pentapeptide) pyrophosphoryl-undecaprenol N-acetylglucosamine transferase
LIVSEKEVDQLALRGESRFEILKLPAIGLGRQNKIAFFRGVWRSYQICRRSFAQARPGAVLAMGGFTSVAPVLAGRSARAALYLHDSNAVPGRANRWLSRLVQEAFVGFAEAGGRLHAPKVSVTGTPVRAELVRPASPAPSRVGLGLDPLRPVLLIVGGSQGAQGVNDALLAALPALARETPELQYLHLTGAADLARVEEGYRALRVTAVVRPFLSEMALALGAATLAISRAGASSIAEFAAVGLPAILIPYPTAADDHQTANARAVSAGGAAAWMPQREALGGALAVRVAALLRDPSRMEEMTRALAAWYIADAARRITDRICRPGAAVL